MNRIFICLICLILPYASVYAQSNCDNCNMACLCKETIGCRYSQEEKKVIWQNWTDYEGEELDSVFPLKKKATVISVRFDGLGCVYPATLHSDKIKTFFLDDKVRKSAYRALTFYSLLREHGYKLDANELGGSDFFNRMVNLAKQNPTPDSLFFANLLQFRQEWNERFLPGILNHMEELSKEKSLAELIGFIPGYNVPYSLAHLQSVALFNDIIDSLPAEKVSQTLFVRFFWPSNDGKQKKFGCGKCKMNNQLRLINAKLYNFVTNRAYFSGLTVRELVNRLPLQLRIKLVSHSFGAVISSAVVLSPEGKIKRKWRNAEFNKQMLKSFATVPIPQRPIKIFMSAPGIPGVANFKSIDAVINGNHQFFVSYNPKDKVLRKKVVPVLGWFTKASQGNSTSLGCNYKGEIRKVATLFDSVQLTHSFRASLTSRKKNHDYFCYRQQPGFSTFFTGFIRL